MASYVSGKEKGRRVRGEAIDLGATLFLDDRSGWSPRATLGYAWGSGDDGEGVDTSHHQTGWQSNKSYMGAEIDFKTYGTVLDPQLSNIHVLTAGVGITPMKKSSLDLVFHHYRQDKTTELTRTDLRPRADLQDRRHPGQRHRPGLGLETDEGMEDPGLHRHVHAQRALPRQQPRRCRQVVQCLGCRLRGQVLPRQEVTSPRAESPRAPVTTACPCSCQRPAAPMQSAQARRESLSTLWFPGAGRLFCVGTRTSEEGGREDECVHHTRWGPCGPGPPHSGKP